jgi:hypothetical protein
MKDYNDYNFIQDEDSLFIWLLHYPHALPNYKLLTIVRWRSSPELPRLLDILIEQIEEVEFI